MKNFSKLTTILGGALLTVGCGSTVETVGAEAVVTAAPDAPIKLSALNPGTIDATKRDRLTGYYSGCEGFNELAEWSIEFGSGAKGAASPLKLTKGDTGCTLTATGFWHANRTGADSTNPDGLPAADAKLYKFYRADDPEQLSSILVATNSVSNPWNSANAVVARLVDGMGAPDASETAESTMVNVGAYNIDSSGAVSTGSLQFKSNFRIETITGTAGSLNNASGNASFIGYASMVGSPTSQVKSPAYTQGTIDATIYTNSKDDVITSDKFFRFNRNADQETGGTEYTYSLPGYALEHVDGTPVTDASFAALAPGQKYDLLRLAFDNLSGNQGQLPLNPSASALTIPSSTLYPIGTDLTVDFSGDFTDPMAPVFDNADVSQRRTVVMISRRDPRSGVRSYQAIYVRLVLNQAGN